MSSDPRSSQRSAISRRLVLAGSVATVGAAVTRALASQPGATPAASQAASPVASPGASPAASPVASPITTLPGASPVTTYPLEVIRDQRPVETTEPVRGGDLRLFVRSDNLTNFNPASFRQDLQIGCSLYDPLVWLDEVTLEPKPCLAERWQWADEGRKLTFTIRDGVTWHDGTPLTATDVAFSYLVYQQDVDSAVSGFFAMVDTIASDNDRTATITFHEPDGSFLFNAGNLFIFQASQYSFLWSSQRHGERTLNGFNWQQNPPIGTGPWTLRQATETAITLARNEVYWAGAPYADRLVLTAEDDFGHQLDAWQRDEVDVIWPVPPRQTTALIEDAGRLYAADSLRSMFAAFNFSNPTRPTPNLFASLPFRQALLLALDRERYRQSVFGSFIDTRHAGPVAQPWARDERLTTPARDITAANRLLDELGWHDVDGDGLRETPAGDKLNLVAIVQTTASPELIEIVKGLDADYRAIGVAITPEVLGPDVWADHWLNTHEFDLIAYDLLQYGAFEEFDLYGSAWDIRTNRAGWNPGAYHSEAVDKALETWFSAYEPDAMRQAMLAFQQAIADDPFGLYFGFPQDPVLVRPGVYGYRPNKMWQGWDTRLMWKGPK